MILGSANSRDKRPRILLVANMCIQPGLENVAIERVETEALVATTPYVAVAIAADCSGVVRATADLGHFFVLEPSHYLWRVVVVGCTCRDCRIRAVSSHLPYDLLFCCDRLLELTKTKPAKPSPTPCVRRTRVGDASAVTHAEGARYHVLRGELALYHAWQLLHATTHPVPKLAHGGGPPGVELHMICRLAISRSMASHVSPSVPLKFPFSNQSKLTIPLSVIAAACDSPAAHDMIVCPMSCVTSSGVGLFCVLPSPSWPSEQAPQV